MSRAGSTSSPQSFPTTRWTLVLQARESGEPGGDDSERHSRAVEALDSLCNEYRDPILAFVQGEGQSRGDADDLVQDFLAGFVHNGGFARADASKGKLRSYLLRSVRNFLVDRHRRDSAEKRGGGTADVSFEDVSESAISPVAGEECHSGQLAYDKKWARLVMDRALDSVRADYRKRGREAVCEDLFTITEGHADDPIARESIRDRHDLSESALRVELHRFRKRLGRAIREVIAHTVVDADQIEDELRYLGRLWID